MEVSSLTALEAGIPNPRLLRARHPLRAPGGLLALPGSDTAHRPWHPSPCRHVSLVSASVTTWHFSPAPLCLSPTPFSSKDTSLWMGSTPTQYSLLLTGFHLQRSSALIRSQSHILGIRTWSYLFRGHSAAHHTLGRASWPPGSGSMPSPSTELLHCL